VPTPVARGNSGLVNAAMPYPKSTSGLRLPTQSLTTPAKTFVIAAADSAIPSMSPTTNVFTPIVVTRKTGSKLWIISEDVSINMLTKPRTTTPRGKDRFASAPIA
jgi:hypothetical protein